MIALPHLSFVQCEQVKFRPKKEVKIRDSGGGVMNFCNFFYLISFTISNKAYLSLIT